MKSAILITLATVLCSACATNTFKRTETYSAKSKTIVPISITKFTNKAARTESTNDGCYHWWWFNSDLGSAFQDLTADELTNHKGFEVLERDAVQQIHDNEVYLPNSKKSAHQIEKQNFKKAKYTIVGAVNSFEYCDSAVGGTATAFLDDTLLGAKLKFEKATVEVTLRLIETQTGRILASATGLGQQSRNKSRFGLEMKNFDVSSGGFKQSSLSDAIRQAIHNATLDVMKKANI